MKNKLIIVLMLLASIFGVCAYEMISIDKISKESCGILSQMQDGKEDKQALTELSTRLSKLWSEKISILAIFIQHEMLDDIEQSIAIIKNSIDQDDEETFQIETTRAIVQIQNLRDTEFPYIENIF